MLSCLYAVLGPGSAGHDGSHLGKQGCGGQLCI